MLCLIMAARRRDPIFPQDVKSKQQQSDYLNKKGSGGKTRNEKAIEYRTRCEEEYAALILDYLKKVGREVYITSTNPHSPKEMEEMAIIAMRKVFSDSPLPMPGAHREGVIGGEAQIDRLPHMSDAEIRLRHGAIVGGPGQTLVRVQGRRQPAEKGGPGGPNRGGGAGPTFTTKTLPATNELFATAGGQADGSYTAINGRTKYHSGRSDREVLNNVVFKRIETEHSVKPSCKYGEEGLFRDILYEKHLRKPTHGEVEFEMLKHASEIQFRTLCATSTQSAAAGRWVKVVPGGVGAPAYQQQLKVAIDGGARSQEGVDAYFEGAGANIAYEPHLLEPAIGPLPDGWKGGSDLNGVAWLKRFVTDVCACSDAYGPGPGLTASVLKQQGSRLQEPVTHVFSGNTFGFHAYLPGEDEVAPVVGERGERLQGFISARKFDESIEGQLARGRSERAKAAFATAGATGQTPEEAWKQRESIEGQLALGKSERAKAAFATAEATGQTPEEAWKKQTSAAVKKSAAGTLARGTSKLAKAAFATAEVTGQTPEEAWKKQTSAAVKKSAAGALARGTSKLAIAAKAKAAATGKTELEVFDRMKKDQISADCNAYRKREKKRKSEGGLPGELARGKTDLAIAAKAEAAATGKDVLEVFNRMKKDQNCARVKASQRKRKSEGKAGSSGPSKKKCKNLLPGQTLITGFGKGK